MKITKKTVDSHEQLLSLMNEQKFFHGPMDIEVTLNLDDLEPQQQKIYEEKFSHYISECGCGLGAFMARLLTLLTLIAVNIYLIYTQDLPLWLDILMLIGLPILFVIGQWLFPLISVVIFLCLTFYAYQGDYWVSLKYFVILLLSYGLSAVLGKSIAVLKARKNFHELFEKLKNRAIIK